MLTSVEPSTPLSTPSIWLAITSIDDNTGLVSGGVNVRVTADVLMNSGGHQHDNNRNAGQAGSLNSSGKTISLGTGGGIGLFSFTPPEASGDHTITATCDPGANGLSTCSMGSGNVWVGVKDLQPLIPYSQYNLIGTTTIHPDNHYLTSVAAGRIMELAYYYHSVSFPLDPVLQLNDSSLQRGGVFDIYYPPYTKQGVTYSRDINGWYSSPHIEHRRGTVIDVQANGSSTAIPRANQADFVEMMTNAGMKYLEENLNKTNGHYHVKILGVAE